MDKKGALGVAPVFLQFLSYFLLVAIILVSIFMIKSISDKEQEAIAQVSTDIEQSAFMMNFLKTPLDLGREANMAELIALWYSDDGYEDSLKKNISFVLDEFYNGDVEWKLEVNDKDIASYTITNDIIPLILKRDPLIDSGTVIPSIGKKELLDINLIVYTRFVNENEWCFNPAIERCHADGRRICNCDRVGYKLLWVCTECPSRSCNYEAARCE